MTAEKLTLTPGQVESYVRTLFPKARRQGHEYRGPCPLHHGTRDSFAVNCETGDWFCHSECGRGGDLIALEMELTGADFKNALAHIESITGRVNGHHPPADEIEATYDYTDEDGNLLYQVVRKTGKRFVQRRPDGNGGWLWNLGNIRRVLYRLRDLREAEDILFVEGEKDCENFSRFAECTVTTNPGGAGKWRDEYREPLRGKHVYIIPDNDPPDNGYRGQKHAATVAESLLEVAQSVRIIELPEEKNGHQVKDVSDWIAAGGTVEEFNNLALQAPALNAALLAEWRARWELPGAPAVPEAPPPRAEDGPREEKSKRSRNEKRQAQAPEVLGVSELLALKVPAPKMLVETLIPAGGACLLFGAAKSGKTILAVQTALAVASGEALFAFYKVLEPGPALVVEQDDPAGAASVKTILQRSPVPVDGIPFHLAPRVPFNFGPAFLTWLEGQISTRSLRLVVLDSYTALRGPRGAGVDIVKAEQTDLLLLDELAKRTCCTILVVHHASKGSAAMDWTERAAGTFAMSAATEAQIHITRFGELDSTAPERLVRARGRHLEGLELLLRFRKDSLDYEHMLEGGGAALYPLVLQIETAFGAEPFGPKQLTHATGVSRMTAHRQIDRLYRAGVLTKRAYGEYVLVKL